MSKKQNHIVIDGGPCSGKTTVMAIIKQRLEELGKKVIVVPEAATAYINSGLHPGLMDMTKFQQEIFALQVQNEDFWRAQVKYFAEDDHIVFLYDRGLLTGSAYMEDLHTKTNIALFENLVIRPAGFDGLEDIRSRYDGVIHMVTAAIGAEHAYTTENNTARRESLGEAVLLDHKTRSCWLGQAHLSVIENEDDGGEALSFEGKLNKVVGEVFSILGYPQPVEIEDKYRLLDFNPDRIPADVQFVVIPIEQVYLVSEHDERVRTRGNDVSRSYYHTIKMPNKGGGRIEIERLIKQREAEDLLTRKNDKLFPIKKKRHCFLYQGQYFEVDVFEGNLTGLVLCEREKTSHNEQTNVPDFLGSYEDVSDDPSYKNKALASLQSL
jgi:CYTH domain-containing protein/predicted ATPase